MIANLTHRPATADDLLRLATMNLNLIGDEGHRNPMTIPELEQRMADWLESGEYRAVLFESDGRLIGYALFRESAAEIYLRHFYIAEDHRRRGLGTAVVALLRNQVFHHGHRITLEVLHDNKRAQQFWQSVGFSNYAVTMELQN